MTEILMSTYRVATTPPRAFGLSEGELYVEVARAGGADPRLWIGTAPTSGHPGNIFCILGVPAGVTPSAIAIDPIDNPSAEQTVHFTGTVVPGCVVEMACLAGANVEYLVQTTDWSPWDASDGTFDVTWWLPPGDNYRIRVRMQENPDTFTDSNLFAVTP